MLMNACLDGQRSLSRFCLAKLEIELSLVPGSWQMRMLQLKKRRSRVYDNKLSNNRWLNAEEWSYIVYIHPSQNQNNIARLDSHLLEEEDELPSKQNDLKNLGLQGAAPCCSTYHTGCAPKAKHHKGHHFPKSS